MDATAPPPVIHPTTDDLAAAIRNVTSSPTDVGTVEMIVRRPGVNEREVLPEAQFAIGRGVVGDNYVERGSSRTPDGAAHPEAQVTLMSSRSVDAVADGDQTRWPLAGDQLYVDFDLSRTNLPTGTRLGVGTAVLEVSAKPHTGCAKFRERFGVDAARWVNSDDELRLRGINAIVVAAGVARPGDPIRKL